MARPRQPEQSAADRVRLSGGANLPPCYGASLAPLEAALPGRTCGAFFAGALAPEQSGADGRYCHGAFCAPSPGAAHAPVGGVATLGRGDFLKTQATGSTDAAPWCRRPIRPPKHRSCRWSASLAAAVAATRSRDSSPSAATRSCLGRSRPCEKARSRSIHDQCKAVYAALAIV